MEYCCVEVLDSAYGVTGDSQDLANIWRDVNFQEVIHSIPLVWNDKAASFCVLLNDGDGRVHHTFQMTYFSLAFLRNM